MIDVNHAISHESTHQYLSRALAAADPERLLSEIEEFRAILAWIAMQEHQTMEIPVLRLTYSRNRLISKLLAASAKDYGLPWGPALMAAATEK